VTHYQRRCGGPFLIRRTAGPTRRSSCSCGSGSATTSTPRAACSPAGPWGRARDPGPNDSEQPRSRAGRTALL